MGHANAARALTLAASSDKRLGTKYVPSFIPPALAAANKTREEKPASVFDLPARGDKGKPRAIDAVLVEMQRYVLWDNLRRVADCEAVTCPLQRAARAARARRLRLRRITGRRSASWLA
jgi:hypothetical protein